MQPARKSALAIGAHPDDMEFLCAGTLALLEERGFEITIASMSPGDLGSSSLDRDAIARVRREEAAHAAAMVSARYVCVEAGDFNIFFGDELCRRVTALLRSVRPNLVFTHARSDYLADHEETSRIVAQACFAAPVPNYRTPGTFEDSDRPTPSIPHLYYCDPVELTDLHGRRVPASVYVDVRSTIDLKERMLACHESQREWLRRHHHTDEYLESMLRWSAARGSEIKVPYAEGFQQHRGHAFPQDCLLSSTLGSLVRAPAIEVGRKA